MRLLRLVIPVLVFGAIATPAAPVGKTTIDPNQPGAVGSITQEGKTSDDLLSVKIRYEGSNLPLAEHMAKISKLADFSLLCSSDPDNWQVRERTATVFLNGSSLSSFTANLSRLFGYKWYKNASIERTLVFKETLQARQHRQRQCDAAVQADKDWRAASADAAIAEAELSSRLSPDEIEEARKNNPWLYYLATDPAGKLWAQVLQKIPNSWWDEIIAGRTVRVGVRPGEGGIPNDMRELLTRTVSLPRSAVSYTSNAPSLRDYPIAWIDVEPGGPHNSLGLAASMQVYVDARPSMEVVESLPIGSSQSLGCSTCGWTHILTENGDDLKKAEDTALSAAYKIAETPEAPPQKNDRALLRVIDHKPLDAPKGSDPKKESELTRHLRGLAKETGYSILMETFGLDRQTTGKIPKTGTILDVLNAIASPANHLAWEKRDNMILVTYSDSLDLRALEVPADCIKLWRERAESHSGLLFNDLVEIAKWVTLDQFRQTLTKDPLLDVAGVRDALSTDLLGCVWIAANMPDDRSCRALLSETGLSIKSVRAVDIAAEPFKTLREWLDSVYSEEPEASISIVVDDVIKRGKAEQQKVILRAHMSSGSDVDFCCCLTAPVSKVQAYLSTHKKQLPEESK